MYRFKNILYVFNIENNNKVGLDRACKTAIINDAKLSIIVTANGGNHFIIKHKDDIKTQIATLISGDLKNKELDICFSNEKPWVAIIKKVMIDKHDLVIIEPDISSKIKNFFYGATTLSLLRKCPCAVWVVKPEVKTNYRKIMAAVDPTGDNADATQLTADIIELAVLMAERNKAECHIVHAWHSDYEAILDNPFLHLPRTEVEQELLNEKMRHVHAFEEMLKQQVINLGQCQTHIIKGPAKIALSDFAYKAGIDLIVMGTIEKTGIQGILIGHTAESLINQVECSILALKPKSFTSPITV